MATLSSNLKNSLRRIPGYQAAYNTRKKLLDQAEENGVNYRLYRMRCQLQKTLGRIESEKYVFKKLAPYLASQLKEIPIQPNGRKFVIVTPGPWLLEFQVTVAIAMYLRGNEIHFIACDHFLKQCEVSHAQNDFLTPCESCYPKVESILGLFPFQLHGWSTLITREEQDRICSFVEDNTQLLLDNGLKFEGLPVADLVGPFLRWQYHIDQFTNLDEYDLNRTKDLAYSLLTTVVASERFISTVKPDSSMVWNGTTPNSMVFRLKMNQHDKVVSSIEMGGYWKPILAEQEDPPHYHFFRHSWPKRAESPLSKQEAAELDEYFQSRLNGFKRDTLHVYNPQEIAGEKLYKYLKVPVGSKMALLLTDLSGESSGHGGDTLFANQLEWLVETIKFFEATHPNAFLVIRIHPTERHDRPKHGRMRFVKYRTENMLRDVMPELPSNVRIVSAEEDVSTYKIGMLSYGCIGYMSSTAALEMAMLRKVVVTGAKYHLNRRGFTFDSDTKEEYLDKIKNFFSLQFTDDMLERSRRYAHLYLISNYFDFPYNVMLRDLPHLEALYHVNQLKPGKKKSLDAFCEALEGKRPFLNL